MGVLFDYLFSAFQYNNTDNKVLKLSIIRNVPIIFEHLSISSLNAIIEIMVSAQ